MASFFMQKERKGNFMKIVRTNKTYKMYEDDMETLDRLPVLTYEVAYSQGIGFFLQERSNFELTEKKVYGIHTEKVDKILNSFHYFNRNLGVLLSGDKGIGKSLFVKMLALKAMGQGIPVLTVEAGYGGLSAFIDSIQQEVLVIFDEFDKNFATKDYQNTLLSLFDGMSSGKKLFAITCNNTKSLSDFLVGRPGRFHYPIRFQYPHPSSVKEYLEDNVKEEFKKEVDAVVCHSMTSPLSFDALRAIVFELNMGDSFKEAMKDLNITSTVGGSSFSVIMCNGEEEVYAASGITVDFTEGSFRGTVHRVVIQREGSLFLSDTEICIVVCSLQGFQMNYETGVIDVPAENASFYVVGAGKDAEAEPVTKIQLMCEGFGKREKVHMEYESKENKEDEEDEDEGQDRLGFLCDAGELDGLDFV